MKKLIIITVILMILIIGIITGIRIYNNNNVKYNIAFDSEGTILNEKVEIPIIETSNYDIEKTTPNTLIVYKTYYTKCKHYIQEYQDIDVSLVNFTEEELKEKCRDWDIEKFSSKEIEMSREKEEFCNQHYKLKLENNVIVIYSIDENGIETEYEQTGITTEYLTNEDILKLSNGIFIYGKENLTSTIEDYE